MRTEIESSRISQSKDITQYLEVCKNHTLKTTEDVTKRTASTCESIQTAKLRHETDSAAQMDLVREKTAEIENVRNTYLDSILLYENY